MTRRKPWEDLRIVEDEWERCEARLLWVHGPVRARQIMDGEDRETEIDIAIWKALGRRK